MKILITGGASGLGESITRRLASVPGNTVYFTYHSSEQQARQLEHEWSNCRGISCNFQDQEAMAALLAFVEQADLDVLIHNAFATENIQKHFHKLDPGVFSAHFSANILPVLQLTQRAILQFRKKKFGKIISLLTSALVDTPPLGWSEYVAGKAYLASMSKSWAAENSAFNITSNAISPAFMLTRLTAGTDERIQQQLTQSHPLKRLLTPDEVADTVQYLTTCSQQINGINLIINAGVHVV